MGVAKMLSFWLQSLNARDNLKRIGRVSGKIARYINNFITICFI